MLRRWRITVPFYETLTLKMREQIEAVNQI